MSVEAAVSAPSGQGNSQSAARRSARLVAVQTLYQLELGPQKMDEALADAVERAAVMLDPAEPPEGGAIAAPDKALVGDIVRGCVTEREKIDALISGALDPDWPIQRLEAVLRAMLRAGVHELLTNSKTSPALIITDYVDVCHAFCSGKEPGMINAVLDRVAKAIK
jgi:transcription antitermination protein NusB